MGSFPETCNDPTILCVCLGRCYSATARAGKKERGMLCLSVSVNLRWLIQFDFFHN